MQTVAETILVMDLEAEISRLRLIIGDLREELAVWRYDGIVLNPEYSAETDLMLYGGAL